MSILGLDVLVLLQRRQVQRDAEDNPYRQPQLRASMYVFCQAAQSHHADANAPVSPAHQRRFEEVRLPRAHGRTPHRL